MVLHRCVLGGFLLLFGLFIGVAAEQELLIVILLLHARVVVRLVQTIQIATLDLRHILILPLEPSHTRGGRGTDAARRA